MAKPYSGDLRESVVRAVRAGRSCAEVAEIFKISKRSVERYISLWRATGSVASHAKFGGHKKAFLAKHTAKVEALIAKQPDITLQEIKKALAKENIKVGVTAIFLFLKATGYSNKKNGVRVRTEETGRGSGKSGVQKATKRT